jgi:HptB-dependent secretion and biofilm anti anti-sigma factor
VGVTARTDAERSQIVIAVEGRFDFSQHKAFREAYKDADPKSSRFVIDLSGAAYLDSSALGMLLLLREFVGSDRDRVRITGASDDVARVLKIANFDKLFTVG